MPGPQFIHLQTFARKPNKKGQSVDQVIGELLREPRYSLHVDKPEPPMHLDGISPAQLRAEHEAMVDDTMTRVAGPHGVHERALRRDRHTLLTVIASYPAKRETLDEDPKRREDYEAWEQATIAFCRKVFGADYRAAFRHVDEAYPHLHIYALPRNIPGADAAQLHPGKRAKKAEEARRNADGEDPKAALKAANRACRAAMREFQDHYFTEVGEPCGLQRDGPRRPRLAPGDYQAEKARAQRKKRSTLEQDRDRLDHQETIIKTAGQTLHEKLSELRERERAIEELRADYNARIAALQSMESDIKIAWEGCNRVTNEIAQIVGLETVPPDITSKLDAIDTALANARTHDVTPPAPPHSDDPSDGPSDGPA